MRSILNLLSSVGLAGAVVLAAACGGDGSTEDGDGLPLVVVTTTVWGDVVGRALDDVARVEVVIPAGADPHDFAPSARRAELMEEADLLVVNGLGLESAMADVIDAVEAAGTPVFEIGATVPVIDGDPHVWMDPLRVAVALDALAVEVADLPGVDRQALDAAVAAATAELVELDADVETILSVIPAERRVLVTGHDAFAYFADRYGFEVLGTVIPANTTGAAPSAAGLEQLAADARDRGVPAIFVDHVESDELARALADEIGGSVEVVELLTETVGTDGDGDDGDGGGYARMLRLDAHRIAAALG